MVNLFGHKVRNIIALTGGRSPSGGVVTPGHMRVINSEEYHIHRVFPFPTIDCPLDRPPDHYDHLFDPSQPSAGGILNRVGSTINSLRGNCSQSYLLKSIWYDQTHGLWSRFPKVTILSFVQPGQCFACVSPRSGHCELRLGEHHKSRIVPLENLHIS